jgi:hypothetical protein
LRTHPNDVATKNKPPKNNGNSDDKHHSVIKRLQRVHHPFDC